MMARTMKLVAVCAVLVAGCTTDFSTDDASTGDAPDTGGDTGTDTPGDGPGDAPGDVEPDGPPPPDVGCRLVRSQENDFGDATHIQYGCDIISGECTATSIWVMEKGANLIVIHGTESTMDDPPVHLVASMVGVGDLNVRDEMPIADSDRYDTQIRGGTIVERTVDWDVLLVPAVDWVAEGGPFWNIRRVDVDIVGSSTLDYSEDVLLMPGVPQSMGALQNPRGLHIADSGALHVLVQLTDPEDWQRNQLFGATLTRLAFEGGGLAFDDEFHALQPEFGGPFYMGRPDGSGETLAIPFMEVDPLASTLMSGVWALHGPSTSGAVMGRLEFEGTRALTGSPAGSFIAPGAYLMAAIASNSTFSPETPVAPPYQVNSATVVGDEIDGLLVSGRDVFPEIDLWSARDFMSYDNTDVMVLHDDSTGFSHYIHPLYEETGNALVGIFPLREDGSEGGEPFFFDTGQYDMPAFDATINPETGAIYLVHHLEPDAGPDDIADVPGFVVTEISCPILD